MPNRAGDIKALIRQLLLKDDDVQTLVGDRIFMQHRMDADVGDTDYPAIIIEALIGFSNYSPGLQKITYDIFVFSKVSSEEAQEVYDVMYAVLHAARLVDPDDRIKARGYIREIERPDDIYNEKTKAWGVRGKWAAVTGQA